MKIKNNINGFELVNLNKLERAVYGSMSAEGSLKGGVGEGASDAAIIAEYDRLGGLITKDGDKVLTGSFYDFEAKKPRSVPEVSFVFRDLDGDEVVIAEGAAVPMSVRAAKAQAEKKAGKKVKKGKNSGLEDDETMEDKEEGTEI
jgi:hypothetical protein